MWYGRLFGQSLCDVKHDFKSSFVAKWHGIFLGVFQDTTTFLVSQKKFLLELLLPQFLV